MAFADVQAVAHQDIQSTLPDLLALKNGLFTRMKDRYKKLDGGNENIQFPIVVNPNTSQGFIDGSTDTINLNLSQKATYGNVTYKYFYSTATTTLEELAATKNSDKAMINLAKLNAASAMNTMVRTISQSLYQSGTTSNKQLNGFADIFAASGTAYAGVNDTTYSSWLPQYDSTSSVVNYTNISNLLATLSERVGQAPVSPELKVEYKLDLLLSRAKVMNAYKATMQVIQRFMDADLAKSGFQGVEIDGVPWTTDSYSPGSVDGSTGDNFLYALCSQSFHFGVRYGFGIGEASPLDSEQTKIDQPIIADTKYSVGNIWCENRRVNGVMKTLVV